VRAPRFVFLFDKRSVDAFVKTVLRFDSPRKLDVHYASHSREESGLMIYFFCWGETFLARFAEFWPAQIARILRHANRLFCRRPQDDDLEAAAQISASIIPFEMYGYGLVLVLNKDVWTLEIAEFPPHARPGHRIRRARKLREQKEKKEQRKREAEAKRAARAAERAANRAAKEAAKEAEKLEKAARAAEAKKQKDEKRKEKKGKHDDSTKRMIAALLAWLQPMISMLYNIATASCENFKQDCLGFVAFGDQIKTALRAEPLTVRQQLSRWIEPSAEECRNANIAAWKRDPLPRGAQRERRLFCADFLPMWLDTIATPLEAMFVRDGRSLFGELFLESECVS
jgi:hypothetical protein